MKELVVIAEKEEMKLVEKLGFHVLYPILITGVGGLNVIEALKDVPRDTKIINVGYAGSKDLKINQFYVVDGTVLYHPNVNYPEHFYNFVKDNPYASGLDDRFEAKTCYTSNDFVLETNLSGCLFDMELAYIAALGFKDIKAYKYVSDNLDLQEYRHNFSEK